MKRQPQPLSKKVAKKAVKKPETQVAAGTGIVGDTRPKTMNSNLQRMQWDAENRQTTGDWKG